MPCECDQQIATVTEGSTFLFCARLYLTDGTQLLKADIATITASLFKDSDGSQVGSPTTLDKNSVFFDTYQTPAFWLKQKDSTGFNLRYASSVPDPILYRLEIFVTLVNGETRKIKRLIQAD